MKCSGCGEVNEAGYRFCRVCGHPLSAAEEAAATVAIPVGPSPSEEAAPTVAVSTPSAAPPAFRLLATSGLLSGRNFSITSKGLTIGRDHTNCQVVLADDQVSRQHAWIGLNDAGQVVIRDKNSANGTYVNQARIQEAVLKPTDEISIGAGAKHLFRIESFVSAPAAKAPSAGRVAAAGGRGSLQHFRVESGGYRGGAGRGKNPGPHCGHQAHRSDGPAPRRTDR